MHLELIEYVHENLPRGFSPYFLYHIIVNNDVVGSLVLREGSLEERYFDGHIGYHIEEEYRGHHYAYQACLLLEDNLQDDVILTCNPHNKASQRTIEKLGAVFLETKPIPSSMRKLFSSQEKEKRIYLWKRKK